MSDTYTFQPGDIVIATRHNIDRVRLMRMDDSAFPWVDSQGRWTSEKNVTDVRPQIVVDENDPVLRERIKTRLSCSDSDVDAIFEALREPTPEIEHLTDEEYSGLPWDKPEPIMRRALDRLIQSKVAEVLSATEQNK